ncbi:MAG: c-type cytochrome [Planctomycetes bacterium]|nr:c-type cytochrome [Planctomycetota bacterium]
MTQRWTQPGDLGVTRLLWTFAVLSLVFLGALSIAPAKSYLSEWREAQGRYNALAASSGRAGIEPAIQQVWKPRLGVVDRCTSCHLGMSAAGPASGEALFEAHPPVPHDPQDFGCTLCHGGQGRATKRDAAHGLAKHWDEPLLERRHFEAGCGACHTHLRVPSRRLEARGEDLFRRYDCVACHRSEGVGRGSGPDLSSAGMRGFAADWHAAHLTRRELGEKEWVASYGPIPPEDLAAIDEYLRSRVGARRLMEAKALAHRLGCRGCHKVNGVGGDDGPDLTRMGRRSAADLEFSGVSGERTLPNWLLQHFFDPGRVVPGSQMPDLGLSAAQAELLTLYMLSLRAPEVPQAFWPDDRVRALRLGQRELATDGESLFGAFCAGCHGERGEGRRYGTLNVAFPAIGNADFLAVASDDFLRKTIARGRPGRRMPAWGLKDGGLTAREIDAIVLYLRSLAPGTPIADLPAPAGGSAEHGKPLFERSCAGCHGQKGEGREAPALANPEFQAAATDAYIAATVLRGRAGTSMRHFGKPMLGFAALDPAEVADIVAHVRTLGRSGGAESTPKE